MNDYLMYSPADTPRWRVSHFLVFTLLAAVYAVLVIAQWSPAYIDFGDGNYMYIAWRIAHGAVPYRDILAPQPPCHLYVGAAIVKLSEWVHAATPLYCFRLFSLLLHMLNGALVARLAWRAWGRPGTALVAAALFLYLPLGYWWSIGYQSEPLEICFLLLMMIAALRDPAGNGRGTGWGDIWAGIWAALAGLTNATAAPFLLVLIVYIAIRAPRRALRMVVPCVLLAGLATLALQIYTGGQFLQNVVLNQVGTYPPGQFLSYAYHNKIVPLVGSVIILEGPWLLLAILGIARLVRESPLHPIGRGGLAWFSMATLGSFLYAAKGGTEDYIWSLAEPAVALLAAGELAAWLRRGAHHPVGSVAMGQDSVPFSNRLAFAISALFFAGYLWFASGPAINLYLNIWHQAPPVELASAQADDLAQLLKRTASPDDVVFAPPYYAFRAGRRIWQDYSELFIWSILYENDLAARSPQGPGWTKVRALSEAILARKIPILIIEMNQTGRIGEVMRALEKTYRPLRPDVVMTNNTRLGIFVPLSAAPTTTELSEQAADWKEFMRRLTVLFGEQGIQINFGRWYRLS